MGPSGNLLGGPLSRFSQWTKQVHEAVSFDVELAVVFFEGQKDQSEKATACDLANKAKVLEVSDSAIVT